MDSYDIEEITTDLEMINATVDYILPELKEEIDWLFELIKSNEQSIEELDERLETLDEKMDHIVSAFHYIAHSY